MTTLKKRVPTVAIFAVGMLAAGGAATLPVAADAVTTTTRTVTTDAFGGVTTAYRYLNGDRLSIYGGTAYVATTPVEIAVTGPNGKTVHSSSASISPAHSMTRADVARTAQTMVTPEQELRALGVSATDAAAFRGMSASPVRLAVPPHRR